MHPLGRRTRTRAAVSETEVVDARSSTTSTTSSDDLDDEQDEPRLALGAVRI